MRRSPTSYPTCGSCSRRTAQANAGSNTSMIIPKQLEFEMLDGKTSNSNGELQNKFKDVELEYFQSNVEGELINKIHEVGFTYDGIIINAGGYTHTSVALRDAIAAVKAPTIEVHISNVFAREDFRHVSLIAPKCKGSISGFGMDSYLLAVLSFLS